MKAEQNGVEVSWRLGWDLVPAEQGLCTTTLSCFSRGFAPHPTALSCVPKPASGPSPWALGHKGSGTANTRLTSPRPPPGGLHRAPEQSPTSRPGHAGAASPPPCAKEAEVQRFIPALCFACPKSPLSLRCMPDAEVVLGLPTKEEPLSGCSAPCPVRSTAGLR